MALGLVLTYQGSGVINFAFGAMAMVPTYIFVFLRQTGDLVLPVPGIPHISIGTTVSFWPALFISLALAAVLGLLAHFLVFRPLRAAPVLAKVVASVGLMITLQALIVLQFGSGNINAGQVLPGDPVQILGMTVPRDRLYLAGVVLVLTALLWLVYRFTRFGLATRAAAENEKGAALIGYSPDRLAAANWVIATVLAALVGILVGPITSINPVSYSLLIVPALGAALAGRLTLFIPTVVTAFLIGMAQSVTTLLQSDYSWMPRVGLQDGLPFVVILVVMVVLGKSLPTRGTLSEGSPPPVRSGRRVMLPGSIGVAVAVIALVVFPSIYRVSLIYSMIGAIICLSIVLLTGFVGQISLAQMTFAGAAGFALSKLGVSLGIPFPLAPLLAGVAAAAAGVVIGIPALRVRGIHLAVVTIAASVAIVEFVFKNPDYTGGFNGSRMPTPRVLGLDLSIGGQGAGSYPRLVFGLFVLAVLTVVAIGVANLRRSPTGGRFLAVRANERAAAAVGINVAATKLLAFGASAFIAGLGGALLGYYQGILSFDSFNAFASLSFLAVAYLGGITSVSGAMIGGSLVGGGIVFTALDNWIGFGKYQLLVAGVGVVLTAVLNPLGIAGGLAISGAALKRKLLAARSNPIDTLEPPADAAA